MSVPHIVLTWVTTARGGAEKSVPELAAHLARMGAAVDLVWWRKNGPPPNSSFPVRVHEVSDWTGYREALAQAAKPWAGHRNPVILSNHRTAAADVRLAPHAAVVPVLRHVLEPEQVLRVIDPETGLLVSSTFAALPWDTLARVPVWVGISAASALSVRRCAPAGTEVIAIPNGVAVPARPPAAIRPRTDRLLVATVARTVPWKRLDHLIRAAAHPRLAAGPGVRLDIFGEAGEGPHDGELRYLAESLGAPVRFCGYVDDLPGVLAGYDVLACAALQEGFGRGIIDAAGVCVPAIVPDAGSGPELVLDDLTGLVYDHRDPDGLVTALETAAADREHLATMGNAARALAEAWYTPGRCAAQYLELLLRQMPPALAVLQ